MIKEPLGELEDALRYRFEERGLLLQALTHSSRKNELCCSNERMEFLGDAILGAVISGVLYRDFPGHTEGELTQVKSVVVSRPTLAAVARTLDLGRYLIVAKGVARWKQGELGGEGEQDGAGEPRLPSSLLSNAFEAVTAAVYLDGGFASAKEFVLDHLAQHIEEAGNNAQAQNSKSALQQFVQRTMGAMPAYEVIGESGPDHVKSFDVVATISGKRYGRGHGRTKKAAEQMAAAETLTMLGADDASGGEDAEAGLQD